MVLYPYGHMFYGSVLTMSIHNNISVTGATFYTEQLLLLLRNCLIPIQICWRHFYPESSVAFSWCKFPHCGTNKYYVILFYADADLCIFFWRALQAYTSVDSPKGQSGTQLRHHWRWYSCLMRSPWKSTLSLWTVLKRRRQMLFLWRSLPPS